LRCKNTQIIHAFSQYPLPQRVVALHQQLGTSIEVNVSKIFPDMVSLFATNNFKTKTKKRK